MSFSPHFAIKQVGAEKTNAFDCVFLQSAGVMDLDFRSNKWPDGLITLLWQPAIQIVFCDFDTAFLFIAVGMWSNKDMLLKYITCLSIKYCFHSAPSDLIQQDKWKPATKAALSDSVYLVQRSFMRPIHFSVILILLMPGWGLCYHH